MDFQIFKQLNKDLEWRKKSVIVLWWRNLTLKIQNNLFLFLRVRHEAGALREGGWVGERAEDLATNGRCRI